ncbi:uncharacterized protein LOC127080224 [Lathyrus oleraceus]|uniref:uncharacterized protein LOC127080224 n=1 Tax=Pisum sativum TaxID=3888 RepID=UPI0021CE4E55|nr:uncharacterized protein LOC127080224 [Pisum sativum]
MYVGPYHIIERIDEVAYRLDLPPPLSELHDVFHVSHIWRFILDYLQHVLPDTLEVEAYISFKPQPSQIMDRATKILRNKVIPLVKVLWERSHPGEANWELESEMQEAYPYLFQLDQIELIYAILIVS